MLALHWQFATATANLASQNAFLFVATHGPIFIASSSSATLIQCGSSIAAETAFLFYHVLMEVRSETVTPTPS